MADEFKFTVQKIKKKWKKVTMWNVLRYFDWKLSRYFQDNANVYKKNIVHSKIYSLIFISNT